MLTIRPNIISEQLMKEAWALVKVNFISLRINELLFENFEDNLEENLYRLKIEIESGRFYPVSVMSVENIVSRETKSLSGLQSITDAIIEMTVVLSYKKILNLNDVEFGGRCKRTGWQVQTDIASVENYIDWNLLIKALSKHIGVEWMILYIRRWIALSRQTMTDESIQVVSGIPKNAAISSLLSRLFLQYVFDAWLERCFPTMSFLRQSQFFTFYSNSRTEASKFKEVIQQRLDQCKLSEIKENVQIVLTMQYWR